MTYKNIQQIVLAVVTFAAIGMQGADTKIYKLKKSNQGDIAHRSDSDFSDDSLSFPEYDDCFFDGKEEINQSNSGTLKGGTSATKGLGTSEKWIIGGILVIIGGACVAGLMTLSGEGKPQRRSR